jgi:hypothetical protein
MNFPGPGISSFSIIEFTQNCEHLSLLHIIGLPLTDVAWSALAKRCNLVSLAFDVASLPEGINEHLYLACVKTWPDMLALSISNAHRIRLDCLTLSLQLTPALESLTLSGNGSATLDTPLVLRACSKALTRLALHNWRLSHGEIKRVLLETQSHLRYLELALVTPTDIDLPLLNAAFPDIRIELL